MKLGFKKWSLAVFGSFLISLSHKVLERNDEINLFPISRWEFSANKRDRGPG